MVSTSILHRLWLFLVAFGLLLATASGGYVEATSLRAWTLIPGYGQGKAVVKEGAKQVVKQGVKLGSAILDATRALPAPSGGVITDASKMLPWNGGGASSFVKAGDEWLSPSFTNSTEWFHDGWRGGGAARGAGGTGTEVVQRWMSRAELEATQSTGLLRGGREGVHYVTDAANTSAQRARLRLALPQTPEVRVTLEVPGGTFSAPSRVQPAFNMPGGGMERTATGQIPVKILGVD